MAGLSSQPQVLVLKTFKIRINKYMIVSVIRCPALNKPLNGRKSENRYWPGTIVRFSCNNGFKLVGSEITRCSEIGEWTNITPVKCVSNSTNSSEKEY